MHNFRGKVAVDVPAGNGYSSGLLTKAGAFGKAFDFFPAFFREDGLSCEWANLGDQIPLETGPLIIFYVRRALSIFLTKS